MCVDHSLFINSPVEGHVAFFQVLVTMNKTTVPFISRLKMICFNFIWVNT